LNVNFFKKEIIKMKKFTIFMFLILLFLTSIPAVSAYTSVSASASPTSGYAPLNVNFTVTNPESLISFKWNFGDGTNSTIHNISHVYTQPGTYSANAPVVYDMGKGITGGYSISCPITVYPTADFSASPTSGNAPLTVEFKDISTGSPISWTWNFGDGVSSYEQNPVHIYPEAGDYTVILAVRYTSGIEIKSRYIVVNTPIPLVASFSAAPISGNSPLPVTFKDTSTGSPTSWLWDFGDGTTSTKQDLTHIYFVSGNYIVNLTVTNAKGTDSKLATINVQKATPTITWSNPADITYGTALSSAQLNAVASVPGTYTYTPAAGTVLNAGTQTLHVDFIPTDTANYNTASMDVTINVINVQKTTPKITWNNPADIAYGTKLSSTQLNAKASISGTFVYTPAAGTKLPAGAQTLKVLFTPKNIAKYNAVTHTVTIKVVTVPQAIFSAFPTSGKAPLPVTFTDKSTGSPTTWTWKFGDGGSLTNKIPYVPVHTYTKKGKYTVSLTVKNVAGSSTKTMSITVK
jgi:PKD repeat protein